MTPRVLVDRDRAAACAEDHECGGVDDIVCNHYNCGSIIAAGIRKLPPAETVPWSEEELAKAIRAAFVDDMAAHVLDGNALAAALEGKP